MSVVNVDFENVITMLVDTFRKPCFKLVEHTYDHIVEEGISINFNMSYANYDIDASNFQAHRQQDFVAIFTSNTSVFAARVEDCFNWEKNPELFENTSNHDSCWRSDGLNFLTDAYFGMAGSINEQRKQAGLEGVAPCDLSCHTRFNLSNNVERVRIHKKKRSDSYHYDLLKIERLPLFGE